MQYSTYNKREKKNNQALYPYIDLVLPLETPDSQDRVQATTDVTTIFLLEIPLCFEPDSSSTIHLT